MTLGIWIGVIVVAAIILIVLAMASGNAQGKLVGASIRSLGIPVSEIAVGTNDVTISMAQDESALVFTHNIGGSYLSHAVPASSLIACEIFEDGDSITRTARGSQLGGAIVGGVLLGGVGLLVGGLSGKTKTTSVCRTVELRITVDDVANPVRRINFLALESARTGQLYQHAAAKAQNWAAKIAVLIKRQDAAPTLGASTTVDIVPALTQLGKLRESGVLTQEEFDVQKQKLLARS